MGCGVWSAGDVGIGTDDSQYELDVDGAIRIEGTDLAEPFDVAGTDEIVPGMVVAIDPAHPGQLRVADKAYDRTVARVISGAGDIKPGLILHQEGTVADGDDQSRWLEDETAAPRYIETVRRYGYRFVGPETLQRMENGTD